MIHLALSIWDLLYWTARLFWSLARLGYVVSRDFILGKILRRPAYR